MKLLNLGCGKRYLPGCTNIDFVSHGKGVVSHNLLKGIPFADNTFDIVYHSHFLEHLSRSDALFLTRECYRVLKPGGIIRIVVPDLENIVREYIHWLDSALHGEELAAANYDWIMLEMYDQCVRSCGGGEMGRFLTQSFIENEGFVRSRLGAFYDMIREAKPSGSQLIIRRIAGFLPFIKTMYIKVTGNLPRPIGVYKLGNTG